MATDSESAQPANLGPRDFVNSSIRHFIIWGPCCAPPPPRYTLVISILGRHSKSGTSRLEELFCNSIPGTTNPWHWHCIRSTFMPGYSAHCCPYCTRHKLCVPAKRVVVCMGAVYICKTCPKEMPMGFLLAFLQSHLVLLLIRQVDGIPRSTTWARRSTRCKVFEPTRANEGSKSIGGGPPLRRLLRALRFAFGVSQRECDSPPHFYTFGRGRNFSFAQSSGVNRSLRTPLGTSFVN